MLKSIIKITILLLFITVLNFCSEAKYVEYKPHYLSENNEDKYFGDPELDSLQLKNIIQVLEYYEEDFKIQGNVILISLKLSENWELMWNYTTKSNNEDWLRVHNL